MKTAMEYFVSATGLMQIRYDKPKILLDNSVSEFLEEQKQIKQRKEIAKASLWKILSDNIQFYPWKRFGTHDEVLRILQGVLTEVCVDEMETAIELFNHRGISKVVNYLFSCVE